MKQLEFESHISAHMSMLRSNAIKFTKNLDDADDLVQETVIKAFRFMEKYKEGTNYKAWLLMIMRNTFINSYYKMVKTRALFSLQDEIPNHMLEGSSTTNLSVGKLINEDIQIALNKLPTIYRYPFIRYFEGYKYWEIAEELNLPLGTVKTHIHIARSLLKKSLKTYQK